MSTEQVTVARETPVLRLVRMLRNGPLDARTIGARFGHARRAEYALAAAKRAGLIERGADQTYHLAAGVERAG